MSRLSEDDLRWLDAAARIATPWLGTTAENPTVGALVVDAEGILLGREVTAVGGRPHAETQALAKAGANARGATLFVTLEPCAHTGRTPPCADAIVEAGIARVVVGSIDPDPRTAGKGIERLKRAGIDVLVVPEHQPSLRLLEGHFSRLQRGRPFVVAKLAVSPDGFVGKRDQGNVPVTGAEAKRWTHSLRAAMDAVMVGAETARLDDPLLNVRLDGLENRQPVRVVLAGGSPLPANLRLFNSPECGPVAVLADKKTNLNLPSHIVVCDYEGKTTEEKQSSALSELARHGLGRVLVEGGAALIESLLAAGLIDRFHLLDGHNALGEGVPATPKGTMAQRLTIAGFKLVDQVALGDDSLRSFEKDT